MRFVRIHGKSKYQSNKIKLINLSYLLLIQRVMKKSKTKTIINRNSDVNNQIMIWKNHVLKHVDTIFI